MSELRHTRTTAALTLAVHYCAPVFVGRRAGGTPRLDVRFQVLRPDAAHRAEQDAAQLARVDRLMDGRHADTEPLGNRAHRQETLGSQELRSP